jgi:hypothetical protein
MALTAFFMDDRLGYEDTVASVGPNGESETGPLTNALNDRPRVVWQTPADGYYSVDVDQYLDINEGGGEVGVKLPHMAGGAGSIAAAIQTALNGNASLSLTYTVSYNPSVARFSIGASSSFSILFGTGTHASSATVRPWLGFSKADVTGSASYEAQERRYGTDHWALFDLGSAKGFTLGACILDGGERVDWNSADNSVVELYASASNLSITDRSAWQASASKKLSFSDRPTADQNHLQVAFDTAGASMSYRYWAFSWRYFDEDPYHAVGLLKGLVKYSSASRQVSQLRKHGIIDTTPALGVKSYYPSQHLQYWRAPLSFDNWEASDYRDVVTKVVREGKHAGLCWSLRWSKIADGTYAAKDDVTNGLFLWCALQKYSQDDYGGAASDFISGELVLEQVR